MKKGIHPDYHKITVEMVDGTKFETRSTYGKEGSVLKLDIDPTTHPAWTGGTSFINEKVSKVAEFKKKFSGVNFMGGGAKPSEQKEEKPSKEES